MKGRFQTDEKIGEYRILGFIGQGGMGEVYSAIHEKLNRLVAVKVLGGNVSLDENYKARFLNEARVQASLHHPNIATLYDFQEVGNELLIFMEFVDGESLDSLIEQRYFSVEESLKVFESIVKAIAYIHENGIIHRDIKTENVKLSSNGIPKLLDFGIARDAQSQTLTQVGGVIGTPNYLAPEQLEGSRATEQTDIWSLGVLFYKMLTGGFPFEAEIIEGLVFQISQAKFSAPETVNPIIPITVANIVKKCLAKGLNQRYQTASELLRDVQKVLNERYSNETYLAKKTQKNQLPIGRISVVAGAVFSFFCLVVIGIWAINGTSEKPESNESNVKVEIPNKNQANPKKTDLKKDKRTVRIDTFGGSAEVWRDGRQLGNTPLDLEVEEKEVVKLKLKREGFADSEEQFEVSAGKKVYSFTLSPK